MYKKYFFILLPALLLPLLVKGDFSIIEKGKAAAYLLLPAEKNEDLEKEAKFFVTELAKSSSLTLPLTRKGIPGKNQIRLNPVKREFLKRSHYTITFPDKAVMEITGSPLGIRFALNSILERAGILYLFPGKDGAHYPKITNLSLPEKNLEKDAKFNIYRSQHITDGPWHKALNCELRDSRSLMNHGIDRIFPLSKYGKGEWVNKILPVRYGKRDINAKKYTWEPCYSHPATAEEAIKNISLYFEKYPQEPCFSLVVNDGYNYYCQCRNCNEANKGPRRTFLEPALANRSEVYYKWVNKVAKAIGEKYPDKILGVLAYNSVKNPPSFQIEKNVLVSIACEAYALSDPEMRGKLKELYDIWQEKASMVGFWEYAYGLNAYTLPRVYFKYAVEHVRYFAAGKGKSAFIENTIHFGQGPLTYLYLKLFYDPDIDVEKTLRDWYCACVGKEAAVPLKKYFDFWNAFWDGPVKKSAWYQQTKKNVYFGLMPDGAYHYAIRKGDSSYCRKLMEEVLEKAGKYGDAAQKKRAAYLMKEFEFYESSMILNGDGLLDISGAVKTRKDALELAKALPRIMKAAGKRKEVVQEILATFPSWWCGNFDVYRKSFARTFGTAKVPDPVFALLPFLEDKEILASYREALKIGGIEEEMRIILQKLLDFSTGKLQNRIPDGSFENEGLKKWNPAKGSAPDQTFAARGKKSALFTLSEVQNGKSIISTSLPATGKDAGNYLFAVKVRLPADYPPNRVKGSCLMVPRRENGNSLTYYVPAKFDLVPGKWTLLYTFSRVPVTVAKISLIVSLEGMKKGDRIWLDDAMFLPMGKLPSAKAVKLPVRKDTPINPSSPFAKWTFVNYKQNVRKKDLVKGDEKGNLLLMAEKEAFNFFLPENIPAKKGDKITLSFRASGKGALRFGLLEYEGNSWSNTGVLQKYVYPGEKEGSFTFTFTIRGEKTGCARPFLAPGKGGKIHLHSWKVTKEK